MRVGGIGVIRWYGGGVSEASGMDVRFYGTCGWMCVWVGGGDRARVVWNLGYWGWG